MTSNHWTCESLEWKKKSCPPYKDIKNLADRLPEGLRASYGRACKGCVVVEELKVAAALKLWVDRGYREIGFEVSSDIGRKTVYVDVLARDTKGIVGVECVSRLHLGWLRWRIAQLRGCLPANSYLVLVFPFSVDEGRVGRVVGLVDEVWITNKDNSKVASMLFTSVFHKQR